MGLTCPRPLPLCHPRHPATTSLNAISVWAQCFAECSSVSARFSLSALTIAWTLSLFHLRRVDQTCCLLTCPVASPRGGGGCRCYLQRKNTAPHFKLAYKETSELWNVVFQKLYEQSLYYKMHVRVSEPYFSPCLVLSALGCMGAPCSASNELQPCRPWFVQFIQLLLKTVACLRERRYSNCKPAIYTELVLHLWSAYRIVHFPR